MAMQYLTLRMGRLTWWLASCLAVLFVFEEAIYGRFTLSPLMYMLGKTASELILYMILMLVALNRVAQGKIMRYVPTAFDICIVSFVALSVMSTFVNHGDLIAVALNIRTMLRYVTIYYIVVFSCWRPTENQISKFVGLLIAIALFQSALAGLQHFVGDDFTGRYFSSAKVEVTVGGIANLLNAMEKKIGAGIGTFGKTAPLAFFLLLADVLVIAYAMTRQRRSQRWMWWLAYLEITAGIFFSYKRGPLLLALTAPLLVAWFLRKRVFVRAYLFVTLLAIPVVLSTVMAMSSAQYTNEKEEEISPLQSMAQLFTVEYWNRSVSKSRGWMILEVGSEALTSFKPLGYGADEEHAKAALAERGGSFGKLVGWGAFDDVYLVAGLVYYGPVGVLLLLFAFYTVYRHARKLTYGAGVFKVAGATLATVLILTFIGSFLVRTLEFRAFAFCLFYLAGVVTVTTPGHKLFADGRSTAGPVCAAQ